MVPSMSDAGVGKHAAGAPSSRSAAAVISLCLHKRRRPSRTFPQLGEPVGLVEAGKSGVDVKPTLHEP
jgi:hypothetical protein